MGTGMTLLVTKGMINHPAIGAPVTRAFAGGIVGGEIGNRINDEHGGVIGGAIGGVISSLF